MMAYTLYRLVAGSYDIVLDDKIIGSLVLNPAHRSIWTAELLTEVEPQQRPAPFVETEHRFRKLEDVLAWLGSPEVKDRH